MERRAFARNMVLLAGLVVRDVRAQQAEAPRRLAFVRIAPPIKVNIDAFELGLRERGYVPGRDVMIEHRDAGGHEDQLEQIVADVVRGKVDILLVAGSQAARAAKKATRTIPIVLTVAGDPLATGLVTSLSRPGGNITGNSIVNVSLAGKRLQVLQQQQPRLTRAAVLHNKDNPGLVQEWHATRDAGVTLGIDVQLVEVRGATGFGERLPELQRDAWGSFSCSRIPRWIRNAHASSPLPRRPVCRRSMGSAPTSRPAASCPMARTFAICIAMRLLSSTRFSAVPSPAIFPSSSRPGWGW